MRVIACALLVIATAHAGWICEPGDTTDNGITACFCIGDGLGWVCAPVDRRAPLTMTETREVTATEEKCEPGKFFKNYCNTCRCGSDGKMISSACTMMACDPNVYNKDGTLKNTFNIDDSLMLEEVKNCEPGRTFNDYCNTCTCGMDGQAICTKMYCDPKIWNKDGTLKTTGNVVESSLSDEVKNCEPGKTFKNYCNTCTCGIDGQAACTKMYCDPKLWNKDGTLKNTGNVVESSLSDEVKNCEPGKTFKNYCNTCTCGIDGQTACTKIYCDPKLWNKDGTLKNTGNVVESSFSDEVKNCEPGKTFKNYCNTCTCGIDGQTACTKIYCDPKLWNKDGTLKNTGNVVESSLSDEVKNCEPGKTFKNYCNTCTCGIDGQTACTKIYCDPKLWNKDGTLKNTGNVVESSLSDEVKNCEPGKTFKDYCNTCTCGTNGLVACTMMACDLNVYNKDGTRKNTGNVAKRSLSDEVKNCEPGKTFKDYCNTCTCGTNGLAACTQMSCDPEVWNSDGTLKNTGNVVMRSLSDEVRTCEPGKTFKDYCNTCTCGTNGLAACTMMACDLNVYNKDGTLKNTGNVVKRSLPDEVKTCEPGKTFKDYCNTCTCGTNGLAACTQMSCDPEVWNSDGTLKNTAKLVKRSLPDEVKNCEPGKTFKDYCNTCTCLTNGLAACTQMSCDPEVWNKEGTLKNTAKLIKSSLSDEVKNCEPGKTFKDYCNTCTCLTNGLAACTQMNCDPEVWNKDGTLKFNFDDNHDTCEPGKLFKYYCNNCFCGPEGKISKSACTKVACNRNIWNEDGSMKIDIAFNPLLRKERSTEFLCQPNRVFKNECNTCACAKDGKSSACTMMACPPNNDGRIIAPQVCEPRKNFMIECNKCTCNDNGTKIACTKMACRRSA